MPWCSSLIEVGVIVPASLRVEPLPPPLAAAPAVILAVGAHRVPGEPDHEGSVVAVVCRPLRLRLLEQRLQSCSYS